MMRECINTQEFAQVVGPQDLDWGVVCIMWTTKSQAWRRPQVDPGEISNYLEKKTRESLGMLEVPGADMDLRNKSEISFMEDLMHVPN